MKKLLMLLLCAALCVAVLPARADEAFLALTGLDELQRLLDGGGSEDAFDWKEGDERVRRYIIYEYEKEAHMVEYDQVGYAGDPDTLVENGNVYDE